MPIYARVLPVLVFLLLVGSSVAHAQEGPFGAMDRSEDLVTWTAVGPAVPVQAGEAYTVALHARIDAPWKLYATTAPAPVIALSVQVGDPEMAAEPDQLIETTPQVAFDRVFEQEIAYHTGRVLLTWRQAVSGDAETGRRTHLGRVRYQICNDERGLCLPPTNQAFSVVVEVVPAEPEGSR
ncbi:MAG: protein-disulfide reductase DsbD domain-containing protein [Bacteroidota bacterium]